MHCHEPAEWTARTRHDYPTVPCTALQFGGRCLAPAPRSGSIRRITVTERRARLAARHHLAVPAPTAEQVSADLVGLHSSDPTSVYLAARARVQGFQVAHLEHALYEARSVVRVLGMRRTLFVVPRDLARVIDAACTRALAPAERRRLLRLLDEQGIAADPEAWLRDVQRRTLAALAARGEATARELTAEVPELAAKLSFGAGRAWAGTVGVSTRVLFLLASEGRIVRARPRGTWISSQYRWASTAHWVGGEFPDLDPAAARSRLLQRWLTAYGPVTMTDVRWWTGWTVRQARAALDACRAEPVELDGGAGFVAAGDREPAPPGAGWVALLPALDPTVMGWKERAWYLGGHERQLFDRNGNAGPTVWLDGRVVGGWGQRREGGVVTELLEPVAASDRERIAAEAERLRRWLAGTVVTPRFRTPLERRLASG